MVFCAFRFLVLFVCVYRLVVFCLCVCYGCLVDCVLLCLFVMLCCVVACVISLCVWLVVRALFGVFVCVA